LADDTCADRHSHFVNIVAEEGSLDITAIAREVDLRVLWENTCALGDDTSELDEGVKMDLAQFTKLVLDWEAVHSDEEFVVNLRVVRVKLRHEVNSHQVEDGNHEGWLLSKPNSKSWLLVRQISEVNLEGLLVVLAHLHDSVFVSVLLGVLVLVGAEERLEFTLDEFTHLRLLNPLSDLTLGIRVVIDTRILVSIVCLHHFVVHVLMAHALHSDLSLQLVVHIVVLFVVVYESIGHSGSVLVGMSVALIHITLSRSTICEVELVLRLVVDSDVIVVVELLICLIIPAKRRVSGLLI